MPALIAPFATRQRSRSARLGLIGMVLSALLHSAPLNAQLLSDSEARRAILDLRNRVDQLQREQNRRIDDLQSRMERLEAGSQGQLDLQNQLQALRQDLANLRGQIEVQTNELSQTQRRQRDLATDLDTRIKRFEPVAVTLDGKSFNVDVAERRAFENSLALFRGGEFRSAFNSFQQFVASYPQSPYLPNVQFWLGNSQYALKDNRGAINTLRAFVQRNPEHPRAADALLSIGNAHLDLGERKLALEAFKHVVDQYGSSPTAATARERLHALTPSSVTRKR